MLSSIVICICIILFRSSGALRVQKCFEGDSTSEYWAKKDNFTVTGISLLKISQYTDEHRCLLKCIRSPGCDVAVADRINKTCTLGSVKEGHLSFELKPDSVVYIQENISAEGSNTSGTNLSNGLPAVVHPDCPNEDNYHSTILGDCYYIPDIDGSLKTETWSKAFEFCKENSLNMWIIDSQLEEPEMKILWETVTGAHADQLWIGLRDVDESSNSQSYAWELHDNTQVPLDTPLGVSPWASISESQKDNQCAMWDQQSSDWIQGHCTMGRKFLCEKPK